MPQTPPRCEPTPGCSVAARQALAAGQLTSRSALHGTSHVVAVSGELDLATAQALDDELKNVEATDADEITLGRSAWTSSTAPACISSPRPASARGPIATG